MKLRSISILNYKNIREANLNFADKVNCFVGLNGQGKTNLLDAIYYLSFTKSFFNVVDSQNIMHGEDFAMIQGEYDRSAFEGGGGKERLREVKRGSEMLREVKRGEEVLREVKRGEEGCGDSLPSKPFSTILNPSEPEESSDSELSELISCGLKRGQKKQFRRGKKDYKRLIDHIGLIPLVMVSPQDSELVTAGSEERRRFIDSVIAQLSRPYLDRLTRYNALLKQRNALLKQFEDKPEQFSDELLEVFDIQLAELGTPLFRERTAFVEAFVPLFQEVYTAIAGTAERVSLTYESQLQDRDLLEALGRTHQRDLILGWTSQGIHKDDLVMQLDGYPLKQVGSQGQQKTYLLSLKLAQALYLGTPILLLDDIFDKLDSERVERIVSLVQSDRFGQIFITDTDRQHLTDILRPSVESSKIFVVSAGEISEVMQRG